jgi:hypothetical protein
MHGRKLVPDSTPLFPEKIREAVIVRCKIALQILLCCILHWLVIVRTVIPFKDFFGQKMRREINKVQDLAVYSLGLVSEAFILT